MSENFYVIFDEKNPPPPEVPVDGYAVVEAANIWDAAQAADHLFPDGYAALCGNPFWERTRPDFPAGEQLRVTTGAALLQQLEVEPPAPEISSR